MKPLESSAVTNSMITFKPIEEPEKEITFPAHFKSKGGAVIALALAENLGSIVFIKPGIGYCKVGDVILPAVGGWNSFSDTNSWTRIPGETTFKTE